jgi:hypothetical protein
MKQLIFYLITLLIFSISCSKEDSSSDKHPRSLAWGLDIANNIRDKELPDGYLVEILSGNIDDNGNIMPSEKWDFYYVDTSVQNNNYLCVTVNYNGTTEFSDPQSVIDFNKISDYASAAEWINIADQEMKKNHYDFVNRFIQVFAPDVLHTYVGVYYGHPIQGNAYVCVWLNADTNEFIEFDFF